MLAAVLTVVLKMYWLDEIDLEESKSTSARQDTEVIEDSDSKSTPMRSNLSFQEYAEKYERLSSRFLELEEFTQSLLGKRVAWGGNVVDVSSDDSQVTITIEESPNGFFGVFGTFENSWKTKAFALRRGDLILIRGIVRTAGRTVSLDGIDFELVHPAEDKK